MPRRSERLKLKKKHRKMTRNKPVIVEFTHPPITGNREIDNNALERAHRLQRDTEMTLQILRRGNRSVSRPALIHERMSSNSSGSRSSRSSGSRSRRRNSGHR